MKKMKITFISDTHNKHEYLTSKAYGNILGGGDVLVHAGDISMMGKTGEIKSFLDWFSNVDYTHKIFIAGNHDWGFELVSDIAPEYKEKGVHYLFDSGVEIDGVNFWGSPWQPEFFNWAFNLPRGEKLAEKWALIPGNTDILLTHGPAHGMLDWVPNGQRVGCEDLFQRIMEIQPKIHVCGHIHCAYGQKSFNGVEFINASVLGERYTHENKPVTLLFDTETKQIDYP
jgi:Icc-related predicted phosphoesterase